jgi:transketolase
MGGILNGMALSGLKVCGSTFLSFSDYLKPAIRMSALMSLPLTYIFTHDSILVGQDGPTHEPIEQLSMLRTIPNLMTYRPADITELMGCWDNILKQDRPTALVVTKESCPKVPNSSAANVAFGAYLIKDCGKKPDAILISSGSELKSAYVISNRLAATGLNINVVSVPSLELFKQAGKEYRSALLPDDVVRISIEASDEISLACIATDFDHVIGLNDYGFSGTPAEVAKEMQFDIDSLILKVQKLIKKD